MLMKKQEKQEKVLRRLVVALLVLSLVNTLILVGSLQSVQEQLLYAPTGKAAVIKLVVEEEPVQQEGKAEVRLYVEEEER